MTTTAACPCLQQQLSDLRRLNRCLENEVSIALFSSTFQHTATIHIHWLLGDNSKDYFWYNFDRVCLFVCLFICLTITLYVPFNSINARKYFFSNRVIEPWTNLNPGVVDFSSLKCFKCTLKKIDFSPYLKYLCD